MPAVTRITARSLDQCLAVAAPSSRAVQFPPLGAAERRPSFCRRASDRFGMTLPYSLQGHAFLWIWIFGRCFRYFRSRSFRSRSFRSRSFRNLLFGRWRLGWLLFGGLLLLLFLRRLLNVFHFIFVSHGKYSYKNKRHPYEHHKG